MHNHRLPRALLLLTTLLLPPGALLAAEPVGNSRKTLSKAPGVVRYYVLDQARDAATPIESLVGPGSPLRYSVAGQATPQESPQRVAGRLPDSRAVRLDRGIYAAPAFPVQNNRFAIEAWVRTHGQGAIKGDTPEQSGTLLSQGNGYVNGWRIILSYPTRTLHLELGRSPRAFDVAATTPILDDAWHHLAATWDGRQAKLYLDGLEVVSGNYQGDYVPPPAAALFRLGYADAGWGSIVADYGEVVVYRRALDPWEITEHALLPVPLSPADAAKLQAADRAAAGGDLAGALANYRSLLAEAALHPHWQAAVRMRLAQVYRQQGHVAAALGECCAVAQMPNLPEGLMSLAVAPVMDTVLDSGCAPREMLNFLLSRSKSLSTAQCLRLQLGQGRALAAQGQTAAAVKIFQETLPRADLSPHDRWETLLQLGHAARGRRTVGRSPRGIRPGIGRSRRPRVVSRTRLALCGANQSGGKAVCGRAASLAASRRTERRPRGLSLGSPRFTGRIAAADARSARP